MSVINQVLQQLEQRRAAPMAGAGPAPLAAVPAQRPRRLALIVLLGAASISVAAFGDWPRLLRPAPPAHQPQPVGLGDDGGAAAAVEAAASAAATSATPAQPAPPAPPVAAPTKPETPPVAAPAPRPLAAVPPAPKPTVVHADPERTRPAATPPAETPPAAAPAALPATLPPLAPPLPSITKTARDESPEARAQTIWRQAQDAAQAGHRQLAIERATEALKLAPALQGARHLAAALLAETGRAGEAEALLRDGQNERTTPAATVLLARLMAERGDAAAALSLLDRHALADADAQGLRGALHARQGDSARARAAYESAVQQRPTQATWWLGLGIALEAEQQGPRARQAFERARTLGLPEAELMAYVDSRLRALGSR